MTYIKQMADIAFLFAVNAMPSGEERDLMVAAISGPPPHPVLDPILARLSTFAAEGRTGNDPDVRREVAEAMRIIDSMYPEASS